MSELEILKYAKHGIICLIESEQEYRDEFTREHGFSSKLSEKQIAELNINLVKIQNMIQDY